MGKSGAILLMGVGVILVYAAYTGRAQAAWSALTGSDPEPEADDDDETSGNPRQDAIGNRAGEGGPPRGQMYVNAAGRTMISGGAAVNYR